MGIMLFALTQVAILLVKLARSTGRSKIFEAELECTTDEEAEILGVKFPTLLLAHQDRKCYEGATSVGICTSILYRVSLTLDSVNLRSKG